MGRTEICRRARGAVSALTAAGAIVLVGAPAASADSVAVTGDGRFTAAKPGAVTAAKLFTLTVTCTVNCASANPGLLGMQVTTTGPFAVASNSCPSTFTTKSTASCTIGVVFAPTGRGVATGTLNVAGTAYLNAPPPRPATFSANLTGTVAGKKCKKGKKGAVAAKKCGKGKK